jgi:uncharacterized damage-inducible protein DinB
MGLSEGLLAEFDAEMLSTRRTLERIPEDKLAWKPHEKSMSLGRLAAHLAEVIALGQKVINSDGLDLASRPANATALVAESQAHVLGVFEKNVTGTRMAIAATNDEQWNKKWILSMGEKKIFDAKKQDAVRRMLMNHVIHHRAQLGVYLRMTGVAVPSVYGPSADEGRPGQ